MSVPLIVGKIWLVEYTIQGPKWAVAVHLVLHLHNVIAQAVVVRLEQMR